MVTREQGSNLQCFLRSRIMISHNYVRKNVNKCFRIERRSPVIGWNVPFPGAPQKKIKLLQVVNLRSARIRFI
jgi:hypothetical protein